MVGIFLLNPPVCSTEEFHFQSDHYKIIEWNGTLVFLVTWANQPSTGESTAGVILVADR